MKRTGVLVSVVVMLVALALPAGGVGPEWPTGGPPAHSHMLVLRPGVCIDLAANQELPRNAHHDHLHVGTAGDAQRATGHQVIPTSPITPFEDCADFLAPQP